MRIHKQSWFQLSASFFIGVVLGAWQYIPAKTSLGTNQSVNFALGKSKVALKLNKQVLENTANIENLLAIQSPEDDAPFDDWYQFALSLDSVELGKKFNNSDFTTPLLSWYALIASKKPEVIYKLYNQGKMGDRKLEHLFQFGFLHSWEQQIDKVDQLLLKNEPAVLSLAMNKGRKQAQRRVADAFFKLGESLSSNSRRGLEIVLLRFAMKAMNEQELQKVLPILQRGAFDIDPRDLLQLRQTALFKDKSSELLALIKYYANGSGYASRMMSGYLIDEAILGDKQAVQAMLSDVQFNAKQPSNFFCAACGIALSADGLIGMPLINADKRGKVIIQKQSDKQGFVLLKNNKGFW